MKVIRQCGFGSFIHEMKSFLVKSIVIGYLLYNVDMEASIIPFTAGKTFYLTKDLFELVMGLMMVEMR